MSQRLRSTSNISNEEIIDDITKDLESSLNVEDSCINPSSSTESLGTEIPSNDFSKQNKEEKHGDTADSDTDSIDEVSLKDAEIDLTDDEKAERQLIAEQLKEAGNIAFKDGEFYRSIEKYTEGLKICPLQFQQQRAILYSNRSAAKMKLDKHAVAIKDCSKAVELDEKYLKAYMRRAQCYEKTDKLNESLADYQKILELDPLHTEARKAVVRLPPLINEKNEKLKQEMMGKMKDLGNLLLKPFGLSTDNFKMEQDPETKGYKINFQQ